MSEKRHGAKSETMLTIWLSNLHRSKQIQAYHSQYLGRIKAEAELWTKFQMVEAVAAFVEIDPLWLHIDLTQRKLNQRYPVLLSCCDHILSF